MCKICVTSSRCICTWICVGRPFQLPYDLILPHHSLATPPAIKDKLTCSKATQALIKHLKATYVYKNAKYFCKVSIRIYTIVHVHTVTLYICTCVSIVVILYSVSRYIQYWVESFNHQLLTYLPKRIHFSTKTFLMRMYLAVLDWVSYWP